MPKAPKSKPVATAPLTEKAKKPRLKAQPLPGLENLRIQELDDVCATIRCKTSKEKASAETEDATTDPSVPF